MVPKPPIQPMMTPRSALCSVIDNREQDIARSGERIQDE
jgi:hypothetical protein